MSPATRPDAAEAVRSDLPILALAVLSGVCGLGYEVLLARGLPLVLGHTTAVSAATIATFLAALALGSLAAHRLEPKLAWVEGAAALVAGLYAGAFAIGPLAVQSALGGLSVGGAAAWAIVLSAPPAFVAGAAIPAYSLRAGAASGSGRSRAFTRVYFIYNLLAAGAILTIDAVAVPAVGLAVCLAALASVNVVLALLVTRTRRPLPGDPVLWREGRPAAAAILVVGGMAVAGGMAQAGTILVAHLAFGMLAGHAAYTIALALVGLSLGALAAAPGRRRPELVLGGLALAAASGLLLTGAALWIWSAGANAMTAAWQLVPLKAVSLGVMVLPLFAAVGASIPLVVARWPGGPETPGRLLAVAAAGNAAGALAVVFGLLSWLGLAGVFVVALAAIAAAAAVAGARGTSAAALAVALAVLIAWPADDLARPAGDLVAEAPDATGTRRTVEVSEIRAYDRIGHILRRLDGSRSIVMTGNSALWIPPDGLSAAETAVGMIGADTARAHRRALVLGMGTGTTAGAVVDAFEHTDVVDASPLAPELARRFSGTNHGLLSRGDWRLIEADAIQVLAADGPAYDLILSTVNSAAYAPAAKIYTREAFAAAARRLATDGVFVAWIDLATPEAGRLAIGRALRSVFAGCARYRLNASYTVLACAQDGVPAGGNAPAMTRAAQSLSDRGFEDGPSALVAGLRRGRLEMERLGSGWESRIDPPRLAHLMADPRRHRDRAELRPDDPFFDWRPPAEAAACRSAIWMGGWTGCLQGMLPRLCGDRAADLLRLAGRAWRVERPRVAVEIASTLTRSGRTDAAAEVLADLAADGRVPAVERVAALHRLREIGPPRGIDATSHAERLHAIVQRAGLTAALAAGTHTQRRWTSFERIRPCR